jgi:hypothetical protein
MLYTDHVQQKGRRQPIALRYPPVARPMRAELGEVVLYV